MPTEHRLSISFTPSLQAPGRARRVVDEFTADLDPDTSDKLRLLASELVTNAVTHSDAPSDHAVVLEMVMSADNVRLVVSDGGGGFERQGYPNVADFGGWGLWLVEQLSTAWGTEVDGDHRVWLDFALSPLDQSAGRTPQVRGY